MQLKDLIASTIDGKKLPMSSLAGSPMLIVNVASR
jgi:glutathione peroxidase-family protein